MKRSVWKALRPGLLVNVADRAEEGGFITPSVVRRGDLLLSVTTGGASPSLTALIRQKLAEQYGSDYGIRVEPLRLLREKLLAFGGSIIQASRSCSGMPQGRWQP